MAPAPTGSCWRPADAIGPAFGEGSAARHRDRAERAGYEVEIEPLQSLALDLDTPEDLDALSAALADRPERAPQTSAALARLGAPAATRR